MSRSLLTSVLNIQTNNPYVTNPAIAIPTDWLLSMTAENIIIAATIQIWSNVSSKSII